MRNAHNVFALACFMWDYLTRKEQKLLADVEYATYYMDLLCACETSICELE